jgi:sugar-specific transcriptional regulator TrmB
MEKVEQILKEIGLTDKEISVYLTCLKLGQSGINRISQLASLPKSTTYDNITSLTKRGLILYIIRDGVRYFEAADPNIMITKLESQKARVKKILPELSKMKQSVGDRPRVEVYVGREGMKTIFDDVIKEKKDWFMVGNQVAFNKFYDWYVTYIRSLRVKAGVRTWGIYEDSPLSHKLTKTDPKEIRQTKIAKFMNDQNTECYMYGDKVVFMNYSDKEPICVLIENKGITKLMKSMYMELWKHTK